MTAIQTAPADPLARPAVVFPSDRYTTVVRTLDEARDGLPAIAQFTPDAAGVIPEKVRSACMEAASAAALAHARVQDVLRQRNEVQRNPTLSPFGRQQMIVPIIDRARKDLEKADGRLSDARAWSKKMKQPTARPVDQVTELRYQEIRRAFAMMPTEDRYPTLNAAAQAAANGTTGDEAELWAAVLSAPAFVLRSMLPSMGEAYLSDLRRAVDPERHAAAEWCDFVVAMSERAIGAAMYWLDAQRSAIGAPAVNPSRH